MRKYVPTSFVCFVRPTGPSAPNANGAGALLAYSFLVIKSPDRSTALTVQLWSINRANSCSKHGSFSDVDLSMRSAGQDITMPIKGSLGNAAEV